MIDTIQIWFSHNETLIFIISISSIAIFFLSLLAMPWLLSFIPADYFVNGRDKFSLNKLNPIRAVFYVIWLALRNIIGLILIILGILMLFLPGPGVVTIILGVFLLNFPAKFHLEQWLISRPGVLKSINWLRDKRDQPPLEVNS